MIREICKTLQRRVLENKRSFCLFLLIGILSASIYFGSFLLFWEYLRLNYFWSISLSYILVNIFNFTFNRKFTFQATHGRIDYQFIRYLTLVILNYLITLFISNYMVNYLSVSPLWGMVFATFLMFGVNYLVSLLWIFRKNAT